MKRLVGLVAFAMLAATTLAADGEPAATDPSEIRDHQPEIAPPTPREVSIDAPTEKYRYPVLSNYWWGVSGYRDLDSGSPFIQDYECLFTTYDGHSGDDFAVRDFVEQDEGRFVVAGAPGTVTSTRDGQFDKQTQTGSDPANAVILEHEDGSQTRYWHLKKWSVLVYPGQQVFEGQPLGQIGSSGSSTGSHLHFSVVENGSWLEPHAGPCRPGGSYWKNQLPHVSTEPLELVRAGMTTIDPSVDRRYEFRPPDVHHVLQDPTSNPHYFWFRLKSCQSSDTYRVIYRDPSGAVFRAEQGTCGVFRARYTHTYETFLPTSGSLGTWTIELLLNGVSQTTMSFEYDDVPYQDPVGHGRTVAVAHGAAGGELSGSDADAGIEEFRVVGAPANGTVSLSGPRQRYFHYTPDSGFQGQDTFTFEVEDGQGQVSAAATMTMDVSPVVANVLRLEGEDDHVSVPDNDSLDLTSGLTLEAWVRRTTGSAGWNLVFDRRRYSTDSNTGWSLGIRPDSTLRFQLGDGTAATFAFGTTPIPFERWTHIAGTWDGVEMRVYIDGQLDGTPVAFAGSPSYPDTYDTWLGRSRQAGNSFRGEIEEMRIWSVARSAAQLQAGASCGFYESAPPPELMAWWRFEGDAVDATSNGNDGTVVAPAYFRRSAGIAPRTCSGLDSDGDTVTDDLDVCPLTPDATQIDTDGDGRGDACDRCPVLFAAAETDTDRDGVADACDGCPFLADTEQTDGDGDGSGDLCDPAPADATDGVPGDSIELSTSHDQVGGITTLNWTAEGLSDRYEVYRGTLEEIRARFYGTCRSGSDPDPTDTTFDDSETPAPGELWGYLVMGASDSGARGLAGLDSDGRQRDLRAKDCL